ncbi:MAG: hypothetical protein ABI559_03470 [Chloroflexota bacterium]
MDAAIAVLLHIGAATPAGVASVVTVIFLLIFAMSFAFGSVPEGEQRFSGPWFRAWVRASLPRFAIAGVFAVIVLVGALLWGNGSTAATGCDSALSPFTGSPITDARIITDISALNDMADAADSGDKERVRSLFFTSDAHNLTHDIDRPLRDKAPDAAKTLCQHVIALENQIAGPVELPAIATLSTQIIADLQNARGVLASTSIATPFVTSGVDPCSQPLPAVTTDKLSQQRFQSAISQLQQASQLAAAADQNGAQAAFVGDPHNLTHDVDGPLRAVNNDLAINLCQSIVAIELHLGDKYDAQVMQTEAAKSADLLQQAGRALGILT